MVGGPPLRARRHLHRRALRGGFGAPAGCPRRTWGLRPGRAGPVLGCGPAHPARRRSRRGDRRTRRAVAVPAVGRRPDGRPRRTDGRRMPGSGFRTPRRDDRDARCTSAGRGCRRLGRGERSPPFVDGEGSSGVRRAPGDECLGPARTVRVGVLVARAGPQGGEWRPPRPARAGVAGHRPHRPGRCPLPRGTGLPAASGTRGPGVGGGVPGPGEERAAPRDRPQDRPAVPGPSAGDRRRYS